MPIEFSIDADEGIILTVAVGHVEFSDFKSFRDQLQAHPLLRSGLYQLVDFLEADIQISGEEARIIGQWFKENRKIKKLAYVADMAYPYVRMVIGWASDPKNLDVKVFKDMNSAREWLSLSEEK